MFLVFQRFLTKKNCTIVHRGNAEGGVEVPPESGVDAIVSHALEEPGQHILRVEVGYAGSDGSIKALRKFYRFQVSSPLVIETNVWKATDSKYFVSVSLINNGAERSTGMTIGELDLKVPEGLKSERIGGQNNITEGSEETSAAALFDRCGRLEAGESVRHLFCISTLDANASIASGMELGVDRAARN